MGWMTSTKFLESGEHTIGHRTKVEPSKIQKSNKKTKTYDITFNINTGKYDTIEIKDN